ncbi:MAG: type II toxin-antitoxin system prevent-host-death family antitoxin [Actinobacteria bacterium]|nr:type II toxin-antitoxin system prevent-host-death family antitoxin [Actinomycetota bacterium]
MANDRMSAVDIRELKEHLIELLKRAAHGEHILVLDHGRPKAMIGPLPSPVKINTGVDEGWVSAGSGAPLQPTKRWRSRESTQEALDEDRA